MPLDSRDATLLREMRDYGVQVMSLIEGVTLEELEGNLMRHWAVERGLEIVGEAARGISPAFLEAHPEIAWRMIAGMRNVLVHQYAIVDLPTLFRVATQDLPVLIEELNRLLAEV